MKVVELLPVYYANRKPGRGAADAFLPRETAEELVMTGLAKWGNPKKQNSIQLTKTEASLAPPAQSLILGPVFMEAYANRLSWARGIFGEFSLAGA